MVAKVKGVAGDKMNVFVQCLDVGDIDVAA